LKNQKAFDSKKGQKKIEELAMGYGVHADQISMEGNGGYVDNIFIEHLWRSVKYENIS